MYKDLAKWLIGLVPVATIVGLGGALAPSLASTGSTGISGWAEGRIATIVAVAIVLAVTAAIVGMCAYVLLAGPSEWSVIAGNENWMSTAFSRYSVGRPDFLDSSKFRQAETACIGNPQDSRAQTVKDVTARVVDLSADLNAKHRLKQFLWVYVGGVLILMAGILFIFANSSGEATAIDKSTAVKLHLPEDATDAFHLSTGCVSAEKTDVVAIGGTWSRPKLRLFGPGCRPDDWAPPASLHVLVTES